MTTTAGRESTPRSVPSVDSRSPFVGGAWASGSGPIIDVVDPADGERLATVQSSTVTEVDDAVQDSGRAFAEWRKLTPRQRGQSLRDVSALCAEHADELAELESRENGKPLRDARNFDVNNCIGTFAYFAGLTETLRGDVLDQGVTEARVIREPYGVVGAILPFNWPPVHFANKVAPALAAGNTIVVKPGEQAPLTVLRLVELVSRVLPPGVVNAVTGYEAGPALAAHPSIGRLTFTGASATGSAVLASAATTLTPCTMELGGKNALVVLPDADLDLTLASAIEGLFFNQGEACTATSRLLVHETIYDEFVERFAAAASRLVVGRGLDSTTDLGPMVDQRQQERVLQHIERAIDEGARLVSQGSIPDLPELADGFWVAPTVFADVTETMRLAQEEVFGPVAAIMRFSTDDEAVRIANGTLYGLTAAVFTANEARATWFAQQFEAGMVFVNNYVRATLMGSPFGGVKASGYGREGSPETLLEFTQAKNIRYPSGRKPFPVWESARRVLS